MDSNPATAIKIASTDANIGRSMKNEEMFMGLFPFCGAGAPSAPMVTAASSP